MTTQPLLKATLSVSLLVGIAAGCSFMKADPAPDSGFLADSEKMEEHRERAPFHRMWVDPSFKTSDYDSILVASVNTKYVLDQSTWAEANPRNIVIEDDLKDIGKEMQEIVKETFREADAEKNRFKIVDKADDKTMILELAITELVPGKAFLGAIGLASWAAPGAGPVAVGLVAALADDGWMAIEARIRNGKTGKVVSMFADREGAKARIVDVEAATWYGHARESMHDWADQLVELANTPQDVEVEDSSPFTLLPW